VTISHGGEEIYTLYAEKTSQVIGLIIG